MYNYVHWCCVIFASYHNNCVFFFKQKTAYEIGLGIPAEPLFRSLTSKEAKLAPSVCRMTFPILASLLVRLVVLLPFQLLRLSLATPSRRSEERRVGKECRSCWSAYR